MPDIIFYQLKPNDNATKCPHFAESCQPRGHNALAIEIGYVKPQPRCLLKTPLHWGNQRNGLQWLLSGGSLSVFGVCSQHCPLKTFSRLGDHFVFCCCAGCGSSIDINTIVTGIKINQQLVDLMKSWGWTLDRESRNLCSVCSKRTG
jgi:hypothetical protein